MEDEKCADIHRGKQWKYVSCVAYYETIVLMIWQQHYKKEIRNLIAVINQYQLSLFKLKLVWVKQSKYNYVYQAWVFNIFMWTE